MRKKTYLQYEKKNEKYRYNATKNLKYHYITN